MEKYELFEVHKWKVVLIEDAEEPLPLALSGPQDLDVADLKQKCKG